MIKVVNPFINKIDDPDFAYNCKCVCNKKNNTHSDADSWTWLPWNTCGFTCSGGKGSSNYEANYKAAKN